MPRTSDASPARRDPRSRRRHEHVRPLRHAVGAGTPGLASVARGERGIALVMALLVLMVISLMAAIMMTSMNVDRKITGHSVRETKALGLAEAGIAEAITRIKIGDVPDNANPRMVAQIFLTNPGTVPALGADSIGLCTAQPPGAWLAYSTPGRGPGTLTVRYKTDPGRTAIYRYAATKTPTIQTVSGSPIFVVTSTAYDGPDLRKIEADVMQRPFNVQINAAIAADVGINFSGNSDVCGYNHRADTPTGTKGRSGGAGSCNADLGLQQWELGYGDLPGAWSTGAISGGGGSSNQYGSPVGNAPNQPSFYAGPWEALGLGETEFFSWVGAPLSAEPADPRGIYYLDNDGIHGDASGSFAYHGGDGEGLLYVDGDLACNGNFTYRGLIYVEGDLKINGTFWLLGAMICKGKTTIKVANGNCAILYSKDAVVQNIAKYGGDMVTLSWREF